MKFFVEFYFFEDRESVGGGPESGGNEEVSIDHSLPEFPEFSIFRKFWAGLFIEGLAGFENLIIFFLRYEVMPGGFWN